MIEPIRRFFFLSHGENTGIFMNSLIRAFSGLLSMKLFFSFFCFFSFSQEISEIKVDIKTEDGDKKTAITKAIDQISRETVEDFLGREKYAGNEKVIKADIIKNQNRYILFSKSSETVSQDDGKFLTTVTLGISKKNLEQLLIEHNLLFNSKGSLCILPLISFTTVLNKKESHSWWLAGNEEMFPKNLAGDFYKQLSFYSVKNGFYGMDPVFSRLKEARIFNNEREKVLSIKYMADFFRCHIVLSGKIFVKGNKETAALEHYVAFKVFNVQTRRVFLKMRKKILVPVKKFPLSESQIRKFFSAVSKRILISVAHQLSIYKNKGALDLNRLFLSIQGPLSYFEKENLEKELLRHIPAIKKLQKKYMSSHKTTYEIKYEQSMEDLKKAIKKINIPDYKVRVVAHNKKQIEIYAKKILRR